MVVRRDSIQNVREESYVVLQRIDCCSDYLGRDILLKQLLQTPAEWLRLQHRAICMSTIRGLARDGGIFSRIVFAHTDHRTCGRAAHSSVFFDREYSRGTKTNKYESLSALLRRYKYLQRISDFVNPPAATGFLFWLDAWGSRVGRPTTLPMPGYNMRRPACRSPMPSVVYFLQLSSACGSICI